MMKNSTLLKWTQNNKFSPRNNAANNGSKPWIHPAEALQGGHVAYLVKFLGNTEVDEPKGIEVVKEGIRKLRFNQQLRKSEGTKTPKVELTISVDGVAIQEPKTKRILHQYPLHRISYCADDKGEKRFFSFIAKEADSSRHSCFVFTSDKLAEEITLTIGQAFDLAYRKFLDTSGRDLEMRRQLMVLQKKVQMLERENGELRRRLTDIAILAGGAQVDTYLRSKNLSNLLAVREVPNGITENGTAEGQKQSEEVTLLHDAPPPVPPRAFEVSAGQELISELETPAAPSVGTRLEDLDVDEDFNPRSQEPNIVVPPPAFAAVSPPPPKPSRDRSADKDLFGAEPFSATVPPPLPSRPAQDPFGMGDFGPSNPQDLENAIGALDKRISEMKAGFSQGLSIGNDDFSLDALDPLKN